MPRPHPVRPRGFAALALLGLGAAACKSAEEHSLAADREVYAILAERRAEIVADPEVFTIEPPADGLRARVLRGEWDRERPLSLVECMELAAEGSREVQSRREFLYLAALDLTLERWRYTVQERGEVGALLFGTGNDEAIASVDPGLSLSRILGTGATIVADAGLSLFRSLVSGDGWTAVSSAGLAITQPLLRGFGPEVTLEPLTQAEREVVYEVRAWERFRRSFAVDVADRVYRIVQQVDTVENERSNYDNLVILRQRNEALAEAGRLSDIQVDQARQDELRARNRVVEAEQQLEQLLDGFKLFAGLPPQAELSIRRDELEALVEAGLAPVDLDEETAWAIAREERLDLATLRGRVEDGERQVRIAADALRAGLDLALDVDAVSDEGKPLKFRSSNLDWSVSLLLDLPLERIPERTALRATEIALQATRRALEGLEDAVRAQLRDELRDLRSTAETFAIQERAVELAERRVESASLNLEAGRAETRDLLEAQESLVEAQNAATRALVDHRLAELRLQLDVEGLRVDETGLDLAPGLEPFFGGAEGGLEP